MKKYTIEWSIFDNSDIVSILNSSNPEILRSVEMLSQSNQLLCFDSLDNFDGYHNGNLISRPKGSNRAFYIRNNKTEEVIAVKGTEAVSSELKEAMELDRLNRLPNRPWTKLENFIYREQKAPLAMLFNEARDEAEIGITYQARIFKDFGFFEEAPLPLLVFKWSSEVTLSYINTISTYLDRRAKDLLIPLIETYGLGGIVYHYQYLPTRIRFANDMISKSKDQLSAIDNLIGIVTRMLLVDLLPFDFEDHGIGQCVAPQNVTMRGGICDLGSIKKINGITTDRTYIILQALGTILTRTATEILGESISDTVYEFDNPTTLQHFLSAVVHNKLATSLHKESKTSSKKLSDNLREYYSLENNLTSILGLK